ncbi:HAMP domain-containing histidine kinase [Archangium violaceum]|uniref:sensor histidine kinase n=1 Tax=Archangium violaceum TaxID=83451 RepID=UPI002B2F3AF9|nr:HAMP domain-containing histidine kinase [Archangium violaceum]
MLRRLLPTLIAIGCGLLALSFGLVALQRIFAQEREDSRAQLRSRRDALEEYATQALRHTFSKQLEGNLTALHAAMGDPLAPSEGFFLQFRGHQFLPRLTLSTPGARTPARRQYRELSRALSEGTPAEPWVERLSRLRAVEAALTAKKLTLANRLADDLLRYHAEHPLPPEQELPFVLLLLERLQRGPSTPPLVRSLLRDGLPEDLGGIERSAGLQRDLLRERWRFTQPDFNFLLAHVVRVSTALGEPSADFLARAQEPGTGMLMLPEGLNGPTLIGERWYMERKGEVVRGLAVDLDALLRDLARDMSERGHFGQGGSLRLKHPDAVQPLETLRLEVSVPEWTAAEAAIEQRYGLKTILVAVCGALAVAIGVMAVVAQRGRYRYIELKSDFVATVSHELRTPLASIRLLAETLERKLSKAPEMREYPERIIQAADGLHFLVENILSFNRIDKGRWNIKPTRIKFDESIAMLRSDLVDNTSVPVRLTADVGDAEFKFDPSLLRLLLINLARNACAYNRRNPVELSIRAYPHPRPGYGCVVLFSDNGIGIPKHEWENVFRDFYRLDSQGSEVHGSGLGLALCRKIMALHGGSIAIENSSPQGTTFSLFFPETRHERPEQPS